MSVGAERCVPPGHRDPPTGGAPEGDAEASGGVDDSRDDVAIEQAQDDVLGMQFVVADLRPLPGRSSRHHRYGEPLGAQLGHDRVEARSGEQLEAEPCAPHALA